MHGTAPLRASLPAPYACVLAFLVSLLLPAPSRAQCATLPVAGCWEGPWDYRCVLQENCVQASAAAICPVLRDITHMALIPTGMYRGQVLLCGVYTGSSFTPGPPPSGNWTQFYVLDPNSKDGVGRATIAKVDSSLLVSEDFGGSGGPQLIDSRAAICHDRDGCLVLAGTLATTTASLYTGSWRFTPTALGPPAWPTPPGTQCSCGAIAALVNASPFTRIGDMSLDHRESTLTPLPKGDIPSPINPPSQDIPGGSSLMLGGWSNLLLNPQWSSPAVEYWQLLTSVRPSFGPSGWRQTLGPLTLPGQGTPHSQPAGLFENYVLRFDSVGNYPSVQFNARPQAYPLANLSDAGLPFSWIKNILVAFDGPGNSGYGSPGESWLIRPPYPGSSANTGYWELQRPEFPLGQARVGAATVLMHDTNKQNRVFVVGGTDQNGVMLTDVLEFTPATFTKDPQFGSWTPLRTATGQNVVVSTKDSNVVVLPDGNMLIVGGMVNATADRFHPLLLSPGGSGHPPTTQPVELAKVNDSVGYWGAFPTARRKNSMAMLLADGTVILAGGDISNLFNTPDTVEIFSPPYMAAGLARPAIIDAPADVNMSATPTTYEVVVQVEAVQHPGVEFVLIRPGAVTASSDSGNRYIQQSVSTVQYYGTGQEKCFLNVPGDDVVPPGYYMLFAVYTDAQGRRLPSVAHWIRFK